MEQWLSVWRHNYCPESDSDSEGSDSDHRQCQETLSRLRRARCSTGKSVLAALSSDVECRSRGAGSTNAAALLLTAAMAFVATSATY